MGPTQQNRLLLHVCCAPCSTTAIERLRDEYDLLAFFYNPNIHPAPERQQRLQEFERLMAELDVPAHSLDEDEELWFELTKGLEQEPEGGRRCPVCFRMRLERTARLARELDCALFATTLTLSPLKDAELINGTGAELAQHFGLQYLPTNFKKKNGFTRSVELSHQHQLYRQDYCGCIYSRTRFK